MKHYVAALICFLMSCLAEAMPLPDPVLQALHKANIPLDAAAIEVREVDSPTSLISVNNQRGMNPASTMKLLTTFAGLEILGPAYRWKTEVYLDGRLDKGVLYGDLIFKGYGDPKLTVELFWLWLHELRQRGLREIRGDIVLDSSFFAANRYDASVFDNKPGRAYNVGSNALRLCWNLNSTAINSSTGSPSLLTCPVTVKMPTEHDWMSARSCWKGAFQLIAANQGIIFHSWHLTIIFSLCLRIYGRSSVAQFREK
jgi:D-alanyl-D-alanine carboxypeptidase